MKVLMIAEYINSGINISALHNSTFMNKQSYLQTHIDSCTVYYSCGCLCMRDPCGYESTVLCITKTPLSSSRHVPTSFSTLTNVSSNRDSPDLVIHTTCHLSLFRGWWVLGARFCKEELVTLKVISVDSRQWASYYLTDDSHI